MTLEFVYIAAKATSVPHGFNLMFTVAVTKIKEKTAFGFAFA